MDEKEEQKRREAARAEFQEHIKRKPGDENKQRLPVEGAEDYTIGPTFDCLFGVVTTGHVYPFAKFEHRADAEEYARWLASGKKTTPVEAMKTCCKDEASVRSGLEKDILVLIQRAVDFGVAVGESRSAMEIARNIGLDRYVKTEAKNGNHEIEVAVGIFKEQVGELVAKLFDGKAEEKADAKEKGED